MSKKLVDSVLRLILVLDWLATSRSHLLIYLAHHLLAHHLHHHGVVAAHRGSSLSLWCHHDRLKNVNVSWVVDLIDGDARLCLADAALCQEVLSLVQVKAHLLQLLQEFLLLIHEVTWDGSLLLLSIRAHGHLCLDLATLSLAAWVRCDVVLAHEVEKLCWDLHEGLLGQHVRVSLKVVVGNELDDISSHVLAISVRVKSFFIAIKHLHATEVCFADTHNDNGHGHLGAPDNLVDRLVHVVDHTIGDNDEDVELLGVGLLHVTLHVIADLVKNRAKVSWAVEVRLVDSVLIARQHTLNTIDTWIKDVAVQCEAVRGALGVGRYSTAKAVQVNQLIRVVEL